MKNLLLYCLGVLILPVTLTAQTFYISSTSGSIKKANLSSTGVATITLSSCNPPTDAITLFNDTMYYSSKAEIYKTLRNGNMFINCERILTVPYQPTALTVNGSGLIYAAGEQHLFTIDPFQKTVQYLGEMPYRSAGDLIFFNGILYMAATQGIVRVDLNDLQKSELIIPLQAANIYGLAILTVDCNTNKVFGFSKTLAGTEMMEIDVVNKKIFNTTAIFPDLVNDAASDAETGILAKLDLSEIKVSPICNVSRKANLQITVRDGFVPYNYTLNGGPSNTTGFFGNLDPGNYNVSIFTSGDCRLDTVITVPEFTFTKPGIQVHNQVQTCLQPGKVWFDITGNTTLKIQYENKNYLPDHVFDNLKTGDHEFKMMDSNLCVLDIQNVKVVHQGICNELYFPTAFTPNGDGLNDVFKPGKNYFVSNYELIITNRWGQIVFRSTDISQGWNGQINGERQQTGMFIYLANYRLNDGTRNQQKGTVTLIR